MKIDSLEAIGASPFRLGLIDGERFQQGNSSSTLNESPIRLTQPQKSRLGEIVVKFLQK